MEYSKLKLVLTEDGTRTVAHLDYNEAMHSTSGAYEESVLKHVYAARVLNIEGSEASVLDIGFGIGYNVLALLHETSKARPDLKITVVSFEKDGSYSEALDEISFNDERDDIYFHVKQAFFTGLSESKNFSITVHFGDARSSIKSITDRSFHAIFHDPFSPSRNPEMWSTEFFTEEARLLAPNGIITTYSSAYQIRAAMLEAGLMIGRGPSVGKKREGTLAAKGTAIETLPMDEISAIISDKKGVPYRDPNMSSTHEEILSRRLNEMRSRANKML